MINNPKVCVYLPFFQEYGKHLERYLESCKNWGVKHIVAVDGAFPLFEHDGKDKSDDGSRELILSYDNTTILDTGFNFMPVKNNKAFKWAAKNGYDAVLIMGADEYLEGDPNRLIIDDSYPLAQVQMEEHNPTAKYNKVDDISPRLVINPGFITCKDVHWFYFFMNELIAFHEMPLIEGIKIHSDDTLRPDERDAKMTRYQDRNVPVERFKIRKKYIEIMQNMDYPPQVAISGNMYYSCGCVWRPDGIALKRCDKHISTKPKWMS